MAINIGTNFSYKGKLANFERDKFVTKAAMKAFDENSIDEGHLSYCEEDGNIYQYKSANAADATTGKWRIFNNDIIIDAELDSISKHAIQNQAVSKALKLKADAAALDKYQYKYNASFVAQSDILADALPKDTKGVDLNGFTLNITEDTTLTRSFIINGTIAVADTCTLTLAVDNCSDVIIKKAGTKDIYITIEKGNFDTCNFGGVTKIISTSNYEIRNSVFQNDLNILGSGSTDVLSSTDVLYSTIHGNINLNNVNSTVAARWCVIAGEANVLHTGRNFSSFTYCELAGVIYICATLTENGDYLEAGTIDIRQDDAAPVSSKAVYEALQLKADKTQLNGLATKTELNSKADASELDNYTTTATTDAISADVTLLMNEVFVLTATASVSPNIAEVGTNPTVALTVDAKLGKGRTQVDEITIDGTKYTGTIPYTHSATATTTHTYNITVKKGTKTADASATINFYNASYYGVVDASKTSLTATEVKALKTKEVKSGRSGTRTFNLDNQKACIAYPKSFGAATSIKDANGFDYLASYDRTELTIDSVAYYIYLMNNATTITEYKQIIN